MLIRAIPAALLLLLLSSASASASASSVRGVSPARRHYARSDSFACLDKSAVLPASAVNDDYCDCADGSDEPGTSACERGSFYCSNAGHVGLSIASSRVNDGLCDPECCDGSDEYASGVDCPNTCEAVAAVLKKQREEQDTLLREGAKRKQKLIDFAAGNKDVRRQDMDRLTTQLSLAKDRVNRLNDVKNQAEKYEADKAAESARKKRSQCPSKLKSYKEKYAAAKTTAKSIQAKFVALADAVRALNDLDDNVKDLAVVRDAIAAIDNHALASDEAGDLDAILDGEDADKDDDDIPEEKPEPVDPCVDEDAPFAACVVSSIGSAFSNVIAAVASPYTWRGWSKLYNGMARSVDPSAIYKDARGARDAFNAADKEKRDLETRLAELRDIDSKDLGLQNEWERLFKRCFTKDDPEYTYEICMVEKATQKPRSGGSEVSLGTFSRWGTRDNANIKGPAKYHAMMFENGLGCWNGPARSAEVVFSCGTETKILSVAEPNKCEYRIEAISPAVCPTAGTGAAASSGDRKDEL
ncbi:glucosidase II beta subunit-like-domain-containing protein [Entophlyctis helioformis]|nr:glucosidase II beta subunit-like-domain-containing protein [Entophlyctis helioformis]